MPSWKASGAATRKPRDSMPTSRSGWCGSTAVASRCTVVCQAVGMRQQGRDVVEQDARLREIGDAADVVLSDPCLAYLFASHDARPPVRRARSLPASWHIAIVWHGRAAERCFFSLSAPWGRRGPGRGGGFRCAGRRKPASPSHRCAMGPSLSPRAGREGFAGEAAFRRAPD